VEADGFELTGPSSKTVSTANGRIMRATMTALPPLTQLRAGARKAIVIPELKQALISIEQLADQGYTTIFHPHHEGVTVHDNDGFKLVTSKPPLLQEWKGGIVDCTSRGGEGRERLWITLDKRGGQISTCSTKISHEGNAAYLHSQQQPRHLPRYDS